MTLANSFQPFSQNMNEIVFYTNSSVVRTQMTTKISLTRTDFVSLYVSFPPPNGT